MKETYTIHFIDLKIYIIVDSLIFKGRYLMSGPVFLLTVYMKYANAFGGPVCKSQKSTNQKFNKIIIVKLNTGLKKFISEADRIPI